MSEIIYHHGIKGMKWGIRRYQNSDGSLTPAGKKRYSDNPDYTEAHTKKPVSQMSTEELRKRNARLQMEQQYANLTKQKSKAKKIIDAAIKSGATISGLLAAYGAYSRLGTTAVKAGNLAVDKIGNMVLSELIKNGI